MRLIEEKSKIIIEIVILIFIILLNIGINKCDNEISNYNTDILRNFLFCNRLESEVISQNIRSLKYLTAAHANAKVSIKDNSNQDDKINNEELNAIVNRYLTKEIDNITYSNEMSKFHSKQSNKRSQKYREYLDVLNNKLSNKPIWFSLKCVLNLIQIIAIIIALSLYVSILKSISKRTAK